MFKKGDIPVAGYTLIKPIGRGQYGEVWEAEGPGGTHVALKMIPLLDKQGRVELKAVHAVKLIRHANLIPLNAIWILDSDGNALESEALKRATASAENFRPNETLVSMTDRTDTELSYLVISMALADGSLQDKLDDQLRQGASGISLDKLNDYIRQAAKGLDFLNQPHHTVDGKMVGIQHRDVKPANLLIMGDSVVVGDFGVATTLKDFDATATAVLGSLAFMAPEAIARRPSQASDQYALAITWYQLRTGKLPYQETVTLEELLEIHREGKLNFKDVSAEERKILRKATSAEPKARYTSCMELAEELTNCHQERLETRRSKPWMLVGSVAAVAAVIFLTLILLDPFGWFRQSTPIVPPVRMVSLNFEPVDTTYTIKVTHSETGETIQEIVDQKGPVSLPISGNEMVEIDARSTLVSYDNLKQSYSAEELLELHGQLALPAVSPNEIRNRAYQLLETDGFEAASALYLQGVNEDASVLQEPEPVSIHLDGQILSLIPFQKSSSTADQIPDILAMRSGGIERLEANGEKVELFSQPVEIVHFSPERKWLAASDDAGRIHLIEVTSEDPVRTIVIEPSAGQTVNDLVFCDNGEYLISVAGEGSDFSIKSLRIRQPDKLDPNDIQELKLPVAATDRYFVDAVAVGSSDIAVAFETIVYIGSVNPSGSTGDFAALPGNDVTSIAMVRGSPTRGWLMICTNSDPSVVIFDLTQKTPILSLGSDQISDVLDANFSPDGDWAVVSDNQNKVLLIDLRSGTPQVDSFYGHDDERCRLVQFSPDSKWLTTSVDDVQQNTRIDVWNFQHYLLFHLAKTTR